MRNKNEIARFIAARFPELARSLPPERKPWMSEDSRMAIFDAAAFAFASFGLLVANSFSRRVTTNYREGVAAILFTLRPQIRDN